MKDLYKKEEYPITPQGLAEYLIEHSPDGGGKDNISPEKMKEFMAGLGAAGQIKYQTTYRLPTQGYDAKAPVPFETYSLNIDGISITAGVAKEPQGKNPNTSLANKTAAAFLDVRIANRYVPMEYRAENAPDKDFGSSNYSLAKYFDATYGVMKELSDGLRVEHKIAAPVQSIVARQWPRPMRLKSRVGAKVPLPKKPVCTNLLPRFLAKSRQMAAA